MQTLPFSSRLGGALESAIEAGAVGIVGAPCETDKFYVRVIEGVREQSAAGLRATRYTPPRAVPIAPIADRAPPA